MRGKALQRMSVSCPNTHSFLLTRLKLWIYTSQIWKDSYRRISKAQLYRTAHTSAGHLPYIPSLHYPSVQLLEPRYSKFTEGCRKDTQFTSYYLPAGKNTHNTTKQRTKHGRPSVPTKITEGNAS